MGGRFFMRFSLSFRVMASACQSAWHQHLVFVKRYRAKVVGLRRTLTPPKREAGAVAAPALDQQLGK